MKAGQKVISWNVNGFRAVQKPGFWKWFEDQNADTFCFQEVKARPDQLDPSALKPLNYQSFWFPAEKPGYSGVSTFTRIEPLNVIPGIGIPEFDREGRVLSLE